MNVSEENIRLFDVRNEQDVPEKLKAEWHQAVNLATEEKLKATLNDSDSDFSD